MASPAPWLHWTQTQLTRWAGEEEEEEEEDDDFGRRMDEDGVIGLGEDAGSPPWGDSEDLEEGSPADEGDWHPRQDLDEEEEGRGSSTGDEGPWGAESDGEPYPELSSEGRWGSGSCGSPEGLRDGRGGCQPHSRSMAGGDTSGLSDASPGPATPSHRRRGWDAAGDTEGEHGQGWTPNRSLLLRRSAADLRGATGVEPVPAPHPAGTGLPAPGSAGLAPTGEPWGAGTPTAPQLHDRTRVPKKAAPTVLPPKPGRQSPSLTPRRRRAGGKEARDPSGSGTGTQSGTQYGRGRLNHPLPDLSKVEARVKFDQSYRPPRGRALPSRPRAPGHPIGFKSPAEIVREVLLSSGEGVPAQPPAAAGLPQEFRSPREATQLVQQLQDDYHKLLTKYAEAENTIDQLRLGARVSLYADPPRPSRSLTMGTLGTGCRVMALSIPQARTAAFTPAPAAPSSPAAAPAAGLSDRRASPRPPSPPAPMGGCPTCPGSCRCPGTRLMGTLAGQTRKLQAQVKTLEGWMQAGSPTPREQLQRFWKLKEAQDALERAYLRARQQHPDPSGEFDPDRALEGEIFRLGLRLEELKERLEPGAEQQRPPQYPAQPRSPPAPSPPPAACSPRPESPMPMEGPQETVGDSEVGTGGLPRPLWHKQLQVEEDFSDLLAQYEHFKSLPESLSLEQLSLGGSGSQEEVDGPAAGDGGPSKVPCRTQSPEEGAKLETSPLHPLERRAAPLPPKEHPWPVGTRGHLSPATTEEPPAAAKPPLGLPEPPRGPLSGRSSGVGGAATQHWPRKEQRIVSPETDSGFVGSEASRVSPPVRTPEHRAPGTGTPGSLGLSIPIPRTLHPLWKKEGTPLPSKPALMDIYPSGGQGDTGGPRLPPSTPSQHSSPRHWAESAGSEAGPDGDGTHTDSEVEGSCASTSDHPPTTARGPASPPASPETPSPTLLSRDPASLDPSHCDLLGTRLERERPSSWRLSHGSQAIRALRDEVWRLRRRLEESLRRSRSYPGGKAVTARKQPVASGPSPPKEAAPSGRLSPPARGRAAPSVPPPRRGRSASLPRDRPERDLTSESDPSPARPRATPSPRKSPGSPPGAVTFRGQYTGTRYQAGTPRAAPAPRGEPGTPGCPRCRGSGTASAPLGARCGTSSATLAPLSVAGSRASDAARQPRHSTPRRTRCPTCRAPMGAPAAGGRDGATGEHGPRDTSPPGSRVAPRAEKPEQPGRWYLAASPAATAAIGCIAPVPLVPYVPPMLYCSPAAPTSAPAMAGVPLQGVTEPRRAERPPRPHTAAHPRCLTLGLEELEELDQWLNRAVEAAQGARLRTARISRVLATELGQVRDLRGSCLF
ncbi:microtubule organization protein AKNA isoform 2-T2 [Chlamydotis macqueenii]